MDHYLPIIWAVLLTFIILMYVLLDGFDLGIGILYLFIKNRDERLLMMSTVSPVWDGNETWLVFGGACLYAAFPLAYSNLLPILYLPLLTMLIALIFRGVAFEFSFKAHTSRFLWDIAFNLGSTFAAFAQGLILGTFIQGFNFSGGLIQAGAYDWFTPFSIITGIAVVVGYALLGATWLIMRTEGALQDHMFYMAKRLLIIVGFFLIVVSIWTPFIDPYVLHRWFSLPNFIYLSPLPITTVIISYFAFIGLRRRWEYLPFILSVGIFWCAYVGFCISIWPYIVPREITIWQAASPPSSLKFTLIGVCILLPVLLTYTLYAYYVFRGKITSSSGLHY